MFQEDTKNVNKMQLTYSLLQVDKYRETCNKDNIKLLVVFLKVIMIQHYQGIKYMNMNMYK